MASNTRQTKPAHVREVYAILLLCMSIVLLLSFVSFDGEDVSWVKEPPNLPPHNFVGAFGAWLTYLLAWPFGNGVWLLWGVCLITDVMFLVAGEKVGLRQTLWAAVMMVSGCGLFELTQMGAGSPLAAVAKAPGGIIGGFVTGTLLAPVAPAGPWVILPALWLISLVMLTGVRPLHAAMEMMQKTGDRWQAGRDGGKRADLHEDLLRKQRELERQARDLDKQARRVTGAPLTKNAVSAPTEPPQELPPQEITIRDHSRPEPTVEQATIPTAVPAGKEAAAKALATAAAAAAAAATAAPPAKAEAPKVEGRKEIEEEGALVVPAPVPVALPKPPPPAPPRRPVKPAPPPAIAEPPPSYKDFQLPAADILIGAAGGAPQTEVVEDLKQNAAILQATLADFGLDVRVGEVTKGPVITRYELLPGPGVKVEKITTLANNIALAMKASSVRILAPIPGKGVVGIEVPNHTTTVVYLRDVLEANEWKHSKARLPLALGKDVSGNVIVADLADMPHLLVAGATGSGKTVCLNAIIAGLLFKMTPEQLKFVFVDPKIVEMQMFASLPHMVVPIVNDPKKVTLALRWLINEMERRYQIFAKVGVRNIHGFNARDRKRDPKPGLPPKEGEAGQEELPIAVPREFELKIPELLPYVVLIVDELADLMLTAPADIEMAIARLAQLARATGIHMILATQRPSVDVVTGVIKANIPSRIAFQVASKQDSRVILDANGADKLLGKGDMLYLPPGSSKLIRAQGVFVQDEELRAVVEFLAKQAPAAFEKEISAKLTRETPGGGTGEEVGEEDETLIEQCIEVIRQTKRASVSILQRRLRIGYTRAARIMDILEERGVVGPHKGAEPRDIRMDLGGEIPDNNDDRTS